MFYKHSNLLALQYTKYRVVKNTVGIKYLIDACNGYTQYINLTVKSVSLCQLKEVTKRLVQLIPL